MPQVYPWQSINVRQSGPGLVECAWTHLDQGSHRTVFDHLADLIGDLSDPKDAALILVQAAGIHLARVQERSRQRA